MYYFGGIEILDRQQRDQQRRELGGPARLGRHHLLPLRDSPSLWNYATYPRDGTNLLYAQNRYYSSQILRFTTPDPYGEAWTGTPQSFNRYAYVSGDPVNDNDPDGLGGRTSHWSRAAYRQLLQPHHHTRARRPWIDDRRQLR